ncbi:MAG TPA: hypothetical protein VK927_06455 [Adhaeribacter sp.]|nr:hypothetical protein [Adhaeribacter sp.]
MLPFNTETHIVISGFGSVSSLGHTLETVADSYQKADPAFQFREINQALTAVGALKPQAEAALTALRNEKRAYQTLDRSVLMGMYAARQAVKKAGWSISDSETGVNLGSSRGAVNLLESDCA